MTDRIPLDDMTSDQLDALYERLEAAEDTETQRQLATAREAFASATSRAARAEKDLTALRQVARGYCPHCGRGDAAPTVANWEQQKQRADQAEQHLRNIANGHPRADAIQAEIGEMIAQTHELREQLRLVDAMRQQNLDAAAAATQRAETAERDAGIYLNRLTRLTDGYAEQFRRLEAAEAALERVRALHEQWVKAGPPPLGTPVSRWWDTRLVELGQALNPAADG